MKKILLALFLIALPAIAFAWPARIVDVADGDTITVEPLQGGQREKVRLHGIDAPESRQDFGQAAKVLVARFLFQTVDIQPGKQKNDRYKRIVAVVNVGSTSLQAILLESGLAWVWPKYCRNCTQWENFRQKPKEKSGDYGKTLIRFHPGNGEN